MNNILKLWGLGLTLAIIVALSKALSKAGLHPVHIAFLQAAGSVVVLGVFGLPNMKATIQHHWRYFTLASVLGFTLPQLVVFSAAQSLGVGIASLTYALPLLVTWLLSLVLRLETFELRHFLVLMAVVAGTCLYLIQPEIFSERQWEAPSSFFWLIILALVPLSLGTANIYRVRFWPANLPILHVAFMTNLFSAMSYFLFLPTLGEQARPDLQLGYEALVLVSLVVILGGANQLLLFSLHRTAVPVFIGQIGSVTTLCGGLIGFMVYGESYTVQTLGASLLILAGVTTYSRMKMSDAGSSFTHRQSEAACSTK